MIVLAVLGTVAAILWSAVVVFANGMRDGPGDFYGGWSIAAAWIGSAILWLAWWVG